MTLKNTRILSSKIQELGVSKWDQDMITIEAKFLKAKRVTKTKTPYMYQRKKAIEAGARLILKEMEVVI